MPLRPSRRLPSRFNRAFSRGLRSLVRKKYESRIGFRRERFRRSVRRARASARQWQSAVLWWLCAAAAGFLLLGIGLLLFSPLMQLREIRVVRLSPRLDIERVQQVLSPLFETHLFFLSPGEVRSLLLADLTDIERIDVRKIYPSTLMVRIALHRLIARLRIAEPEKGGAEEAGTGSTMDFLTAEGVYVQSAVIAEREESLPLIELVDWGVRPAPGSPLVPLDLLDLLSVAEEELHEQFGYEIDGRTIYLRGQEVHIEADGITLWFDQRSPVGQSLRRYRTLLLSVPREEITQYVDLRLRDRVVYK